MHLGRPYPFLSDRWACSTCFWPNFLPQFLVLDFAGPNLDWLEIGFFDSLSLVGEVVTEDREDVQWSFTEEEPPATHQMVLEYTRYNFLGGWFPEFNLFIQSVLPGVTDKVARAVGPLANAPIAPWTFAWSDAYDYVAGHAISVPNSYPRVAVYADLP